MSGSPNSRGARLQRLRSDLSKSTSCSAASPPSVQPCWHEVESTPPPSGSQSGQRAYRQVSLALRKAESKSCRHYRQVARMMGRSIEQGTQQLHRQRTSPGARGSQAIRGQGHATWRISRPKHYAQLACSTSGRLPRDQRRSSPGTRQSRQLKAASRHEQPSRCTRAYPVWHAPVPKTRSMHKYVLGIGVAPRMRACQDMTHQM
mmetsp:Transcript_2240/g.7125  ORF Transcript_2240/g.7125 Transcript_2240/m.7125 type:complete len:204 (+) Transcript_2240:669-1280(+)